MILRILIIMCVLDLTALRLYGQTAIPSEDSDAIRNMNFNHFSDYFLPDKISDLLMKAQGAHQSEVVVGKDLHYLHEHISKGLFPAADLASLAVNSAIVVEGIPRSRKSGPCAGGTFVCSDYTVLISRIWRNQNISVLAGQTIVVARGGGEYKLNGVSIRGIDANFHLFKLGERYIFFLKLIPESGAFKVNPGEAFLEEGDKIVDGRSSRGIDPTDRTVFLRELEIAVQTRTLGVR